MACNSQSGLMQLGCCGGSPTYENRELSVQIGAGDLTGSNPDYYGKYLLCRAYATDYDMETVPIKKRRLVFLDANGNVSSTLDVNLNPAELNVGILITDLITFQASDSSTRRVQSERFMRVGPSPQPSKIVHNYKSGCDTRYTDFIFQPDIIPAFGGVPISHQDDVAYNVLDPSCTLIP